MAYTTIDDPSAHFHTRLYTATGNAISVTNNANAGNFQPDWIWLKSRNNATNHNAFDSSRGQTKRLYPNLTDQEDTVGTFALNSNGFSIGGSGSSGIGDINVANKTMVAWQWKANGGTTSSNTSGSVTSTVQANTTAGISIVTWTAANGAYTIGHGLGTTPAMVITKDRDTSERNWWTWHQAFGDPASAGGYVALNTTSAKATAANSIWGTQGLSSTLFGFDASTSQNDAHVGYFFAEKKGYSKFGSYIGNGSSDGTFVYTGFKPAWLMVKRSDGSNDWVIFDNKRTPSNVIRKYLYSNSSTQEDSASAGFSNMVDFVSNGFKLRNTFNNSNGSGVSIIYMAFAEHPFVSSEGVPVTAR